MIIINDTCTINIKNDDFGIPIGDSRVMLQIVVSLTDSSRDIIPYHNVFIVHFIGRKLWKGKSF
jgi:hypothetical protein